MILFHRYIIQGNHVPYKSHVLCVELTLLQFDVKCYDQGEAAGYLYPQHSPTSRQGYQVRVTMCRNHVIYNHMIYTTQGYVTFEPGEPTGGMA